MAQPQVIIYTTPICIYCRMVKEFFTKHNVIYEEKDVSKNERALDEMVEKSHQMGVPVIDIGGEIFVGFDRAALAHVLNIKT